MSEQPKKGIAKSKGGRPSKYTQAIADRICAELADGKSLRSVCKPSDMPSTQTFFNWLRTKDGFLEQYEIAKEECADLFAEEIIEIADDSTKDYEDIADDNGATGATRLNSEHVQRSRLRIDARKWVASKLKPKKYGDKVSQEISGPGGGAIQTATTFNFIPVGSDD